MKIFLKITERKKQKGKIQAKKRQKSPKKFDNLSQEKI